MAERKTERRLEIIAEALRRRAIELWGPARAAEIKSVLEQTGRHIWRVSEVPLTSDDEPAFDLSGYGVVHLRREFLRGGRQNADR